MGGTLIGIATRPAHRAPMEEHQVISVSIERGLEGDHKGSKFPLRQVTVLGLGAWQAALSEVSDACGPVELPWTARRANLLVEGVQLPRAKGGIIAIGDVQLEITAQTVPCGRMDEAQPGLLKALHPDWRGGVTCRVLAGGLLSLKDSVSVLVAPPERRVQLPG